ncbi:hypothetical protein I5F00_08475 [Proteus mirabilis]|uniref:hypothetical protein n=1 Tax=Proteus mirabilis TaxID=584 RepID=UPI0018C485C9|nr:hypothetical protein [Proteus mirabilis]
MTPKEYAVITAKKIIDNPYSAMELVEEAERVLEKSNISEYSKKQFWIDLHFELKDHLDLYLVAGMESQDSEDLSKIIAQAKAAIAKKAG